jgi:nitroreductase
MRSWRFAVSEDRIRVFADYTRWRKVADADQRELHINVGCALENLLIAAEHFGLVATTLYFPDPADAALVAEVVMAVDQELAAARPAGLFEMIPVRNTNRRPYEERPIDEADLERLRACCTEDGVSLFLLDHPAIRRQTDELLIRADAVEFADPAYREELGYWIGQGVYGTSWLMSKIRALAVTYLNAGKLQAKYAEAVLMTSPLLAVLGSARNDRTSQVKVGQVFERTCLLAALLGIGVQPMSQIVEIAELKDELAKLLPPPGAIPQHPFRLGYTPWEPERTSRRQLGEFLVST